MLTKSLLNPILADEALTRGLGDAEARILVEWLVEQAETVAQTRSTEAEVDSRIRYLCRRGRAIGRFVTLWCHTHARGAAGQLAVAEGFAWPFPSPAADPCEIMNTILQHEAEQLGMCSRSS
jgi:hypothetical protein